MGDKCATQSYFSALILISLLVIIIFLSQLKQLAIRISNHGATCTNYQKVNQQASDLNLTSKMAADPVAITPKSIPLPKTADIVSSADGSYLTYPPFPTAPGVIPFKEFKEGGICIEPGPDDAEVDTFGIPTVPIRSRHSTDHCKTKSKRKWEDMKGKKGKKSKPIEQRLWWEQWEDAEAIRFCTGFNPWVDLFFIIIPLFTFFVISPHKKTMILTVQLIISQICFWSRQDYSSCSRLYEWSRLACQFSFWIWSKIYMGKGELIWSFFFPWSHLW